MRLIFTAVFSICFLCNSLGQALQLLPYPNTIKIEKGVCTLHSSTVIYTPTTFNNEASFLQFYINELLGFKLKVLSKEEVVNQQFIQLIEDVSLERESYQLQINTGGVAIKASTATGIFYGVQTLRQLLEKSDELPFLSIEDSPRFSWRAFMLDEARHFKGTKEVKRLLDEMAYLKMNIFHWHLVDNQGWRLEIKKYPLLTKKGSVRDSTHIGGFKSNNYKKEVHKGYYTQDQIRDIVTYAQKRHITIVPEIEMPGHATAAIAAYSWLGSSKKEIPVQVRFGPANDVFDISSPKVISFLKDVLDETIELFPSKTIHIGGDEVRFDDHWKNNDSINAYMKQKGISTYSELQVNFTNEISQYLQSKGRRMMGWNDITGDAIHGYSEKRTINASEKLSKDAVIHFWKGDVNLISKAAKEGHSIINSTHFKTYLDYGFALPKAYSFNPIPKGLHKNYHQNIKGMGTQMWTEWVPDIKTLHKKVFPRLAAYAEVGWTDVEKKDWNRFLNSLHLVKTHWEQKGILYDNSPKHYIQKELK